MSEISKEVLDRAVDKAIAAKTNAYCPYSDFRVGVAVVTENDEIYTGANVENASYGLTMCAERVAIYNAVSSGAKHIRAVVVNTDVDKFKWCCGACCGVILEFGEEIQVYSSKSNKETQRKGIRELVPFSFCAADLREPKTVNKPIMFSQ